MPTTEHFNRDDRDLLVELRTEMQGVRDDIKDLKDGTSTRLTHLETDHVSREQYADHETRMRFVEKYVWGAIAIIGLINLIGFGYLFTHFH